MLLQDLEKKKLIRIHKWIPENTMYLTQMGSVAYGVSGNDSDIDVYGFCIPLKNMVFPHLDGYIEGFGTQNKPFETWCQHGIKDNNKEYDLNIYSIVKFFQLCMENNSNTLDALFSPRRCVIHSTQLGELVKANRKIFLHKGAWFRFRGYAFATLGKLINKNMAHFIKFCQEKNVDPKITLEQVREELDARQNNSTK